MHEFHQSFSLNSNIWPLFRSLSSPIGHRTRTTQGESLNFYLQYSVLLLGVISVIYMDTPLRLSRYISKPPMSTVHVLNSEMLFSRYHNKLNAKHIMHSIYLGYYMNLSGKPYRAKHSPPACYCHHFMHLYMN